MVVTELRGILEGEPADLPIQVRVGTKFLTVETVTLIINPDGTTAQVILDTESS